MNSIPKIYRFGERFTNGILEDLVVVQEKYDGSQFSFCLTGGKLVCRSKTTEAGPMFQPAIDFVTRLAPLLLEGHEYHCEFIAKPKHNVLTYGRAPKSFLVLFDVRHPKGGYLPADIVRETAENLGLEPAQTFYTGYLPATFSDWNTYFEKPSSLGGVIEGVVVKNYYKPHGERPEHPMTAKVVCERFKERQACRPQKVKSEKGEAVQPIVNSLRTEARWLKAISHLKDAGKLTDSMKDVGPLIAELQADTLAEETDWIKQQLFDQFSKEITRGVCQGFAQWYQRVLASGGLSVWQETQIQ